LISYQRTIDVIDLSMYYVYAHIDAETGKPFYIGKGIGGRCSSSQSRARRWVEYTKTHNWYPVLLYKGLLSHEALTKEHETILLCRREGIHLVNAHDGIPGKPPKPQPPVIYDMHVRAYEWHVESERRYKRIMVEQARIRF